MGCSNCSNSNIETHEETFENKSEGKIQGKQSKPVIQTNESKKQYSQSPVIHKRQNDNVESINVKVDNRKSMENVQMHFKMDLFQNQPMPINFE